MTELYRANDGTIFEDEDDCLRYERMVKYADNTSLLFADLGGKYISMESIINGENFLDEVCFIICKSYEGYQVLCELCDEIGLTAPENWGDMNDKETPRCWFWREDKYPYGNWDTLYSALEEAKRLKNIFENLAEKG